MYITKHGSQNVKYTSEHPHIALHLSEVRNKFILTFWRRNYYFFNFSTPCIWNVNNIGTKYFRIMKQTGFEEKKTESIHHV